MCITVIAGLFLIIYHVKMKGPNKSNLNITVVLIYWDKVDYYKNLLFAIQKHKFKRKYELFIGTERSNVFNHAIKSRKLTFWRFEKIDI